MTGPEHYRRAQELMAAVTQETHYGAAVIVAADTIVIVAAQVHATLALAAATALGSDGGQPAGDADDWRFVASAGINGVISRPVAS